MSHEHNNCDIDFEKTYSILAREIITHLINFWSYIHFDTTCIMKSKSSILVVTNKVQFIYVFKVFESEHIKQFGTVHVS